MSESDSGNVGGDKGSFERVTIPIHVGVATEFTLKRGDVSATIEWTDERFVFRFRDERPEADRVLDAPEEYEFTWTPDCGVNVKEPPNGQA